MNIWKRAKLYGTVAISTLMPMKTLGQTNATTQNDAVRSEWRARVNNQKDTTVFSVLSRDYHKIGVPKADSLATIATNKFTSYRDRVSEEAAAAYLEKIYAPIANRLVYDSTMVLLRDKSYYTEKVKELNADARDAAKACYNAFKEYERTRQNHSILYQQEYAAWEAKREQAKKDNGATYVTPIFVASPALRDLDHAHVEAERQRDAKMRIAADVVMKAWTASCKNKLAHAEDIKSALDKMLKDRDALEAFIKKCDEDLKNFGRLEIKDKALSGDKNKDKEQVKGNKKNIKQNDKNDATVDQILTARQEAVSTLNSMLTKEEIKKRQQEIDKIIGELKTTLDKIKRGEITTPPGTELIDFEDSDLAEAAGLKKGKDASKAAPTKTTAAPVATKPAPAKQVAPDNEIIVAPRATAPAPKPVDRDAEIAQAIAEVEANGEKLDSVIYYNGSTRDSYMENDGTVSHIFGYPEGHRNKAAVMRGNITTVYLRDNTKTVYEIVGNDVIVKEYDAKDSLVNMRQERDKGTSEEIFKAIGLYESKAVAHNEAAQIKSGYQNTINKMVEQFRTKSNC